MGFSFVHAADLHLDTPFKGIGEVAPEVAAALRDASLTAFDRLVDLCLERDAALLVIAGDVYDGAERGIRAQLRFRDGLEALSDAGVPSFVVHGNHDPVGGWSAVNAWPPLVTVFDTDAVGSVEVRREGHLLAVVHGISYWRRDVRENLALRFRRSPADAFQIGVLHANVTGAADGYDDYSPCSLDDLCRSGIDYWALGHIHSAMVLSGRPHADEPWVVYPGNLQARSPKPSERGPKGALVVHVDDGRVASVEPVACDLVRFADADLDVTGYADIDEVRSGLLDLAAEQLDEAGGRSVVLRGRLVGRSEVHRAFARRGALDELQAAVRGQLPAGDRFCWLDRLEDASASPLDLGAVRRGSDFAGDLVRLADELAALPADGAGLLDDLASALPKALQSRFIALAGSGVATILEPAVTIALDELGVDA
jgi:DNA repair exonuclease SbcCD nuclease subunit